jgi:putative intracellular protease/amidase
MELVGARATLTSSQEGRPLVTPKEAGVCHSTAVLCQAGYNGTPNVRGKRVSGSINGGDEAAHPAKVAPFLLSDLLSRLDGKCERAPDWRSFAIIDGRLIAAQNRACSTAAVQALLMASSHA